ncbi:MAG: N-acetyltransferase [Bacteroidota bacterium]
MEYVLRKESPQDYHEVERLVEVAFQSVEHSDHREHLLVARLRKSASFIPDLSIVAVYEDQLVGHILVTKIQITHPTCRFESLALAPVSVLPAFQGKGIGGKLIQGAHRVAKDLGYGSIVLLGHAGYYPRFGYQKASHFNIALPFEVPDENCMAIELQEGALGEVHGTVVYDPAFYE